MSLLGSVFSRKYCSYYLLCSKVIVLQSSTYFQLAYYSVYVLRKMFDLFSGYAWGKLWGTLDERKWLRRIVFLETVAGVPGMVGAMVRHLRSLRHMDRDHGWIHTLLGVYICVHVCACMCVGALMVNGLMSRVLAGGKFLITQLHEEMCVQIPGQKYQDPRAEGGHYFMFIKMYLQICKQRWLNVSDSNIIQFLLRPIKQN